MQSMKTLLVFGASCPISPLRASFAVVAGAALSLLVAAPAHAQWTDDGTAVYVSGTPGITGGGGSSGGNSASSVSVFVNAPPSGDTSTANWSKIMKKTYTWTGYGPPSPSFQATGSGSVTGSGQSAFDNNTYASAETAGNGYVIQSGQPSPFSSGSFNTGAYNTFSYNLSPAGAVTVAGGTGSKLGTAEFFYTLYANVEYYGGPRGNAAAQAQATTSYVFSGVQ